MTQDQLAEAIYQDRTMVSKIEHDKARIDLDTFLRWVDVTNAKEVLVAYLCGLDGLTIMQNILQMGAGIINLALIVA